MVNELKSYSLNVDVTDPHASSSELKHEYGFELTENPGTEYDAVIVTVPHSTYKKINDAEFASITKPHALIADLKGTYRGLISSRSYWSL
jgi:UDP-N-acetyl-D-galactosamine dehydrogenase